MAITFINKPNGTVPGATSKHQPSVSADPEESLDGPTKPSGKLRNDLLPGFTVGMVAPSALVSGHHPVRKLSQRQVARVAQPIRRYGFRTPPLIGAGNEIIDGHIRVEAARRLGLKKIPCIVVEDLSEEEIRLLRIALNRIQERGDWDEQALKLEFAFLLEFEPELTVTGFDAPEIDRILVLDDLGTDEADPLDKLGDLPNPDAAAVSRLGDLWHLGRHRVLCGNARSIDDIGLVIGDRELSAVFADHPFNLSVKKDISVGSGKFAEFAEASGGHCQIKLAFYGVGWEILRLSCLSAWC